MSIKYAILGLLNYSDMHGYRIKEHIEKNFGHMWSINFGQIYSNLKDLEQEGMISMIDVVSSEDGGPQKKLYSITDKGLDEFFRWLAESPQKPMIIRDPFLLKFPFFGFGDGERALELIDEQIENCESQLKRRKKNRSHWEGQSLYVRLIVELGINLNEMYLEWLRHSRAELEKSAEKTLAEKV